MLFPLVAVACLAYLLLRPALLQPRVRRWRVPRPSRAAGDKAVAIGIVVAALVVLVHGNVWAAFCLFGLSLWMLGRAARSARPAAARTDTRRSATVELSTDLGTGRRTARMVAGPHRGAILDALALSECFRLLAASRAADPSGAALLETYLDGRAPLWRAAADADRDARAGRSRATNGMTEEQAYELLGLGRGAPREAVVRAHRTLMKRWHPDGGGTAELAARANEAKEVLLRQHG